MRHLKTIGLAAAMAMALTAFTAASAWATTLETGGVTKNESVAFTFSLEPNTTLLIANTAKSLTNTCKKGAVGGATEITDTTSFTGSKVTGALNELTFQECVHEPVTVEPAGRGQLYVEHIAGTTNATVFSENMKLTVPTSLPDTTHVTCVTFTGARIGTLTGKSSGNATVDINAVLNCGFLLPSAIWIGSYVVTTPSNGLGVSA